MLVRAPAWAKALVSKATLWGSSAVLGVGVKRVLGGLTQPRVVQANKITVPLVAPLG